MTGHGRTQAATERTEAEIELRARLAQLETENGRLWAALEREQENTRGALARLEEAEARSKVLIAAAGQGRLNAPTGEEFSDFSDPSTRAREGDTENSEKGGGERRGFWARLRRKG